MLSTSLSTPILIFILFLATPPQTTNSQISLLDHQETFRFGESKNRSFTLNFSPIAIKSEQISIDGKILSKNNDYEINYQTATVTLKGDFSPDATVKIDYKILPFKIKKVYKHEIFYEKQSPVKVKKPVNFSNKKSKNRELETSTLKVAGTQTFGISIGTNSSLKQNQELRISIDGKVSENIEVMAILSDSDLPLQPEGVTENIQEIDQKLVRLTSPNVTATLGDFVGSIGNPEVQFPMALEGVWINGNFNRGNFSIIPSAVPKGKSARKIIKGIEGHSQYRIDVDGKFVVVKAGSETVWLNGKTMRRGENNDYVIRDYGDAIVEFTNKHFITENDLLRIDFEYISENQAYRQNLRGVAGKWQLDEDRAQFGFSYAISEDRNDAENRFISLSDEELERLRKNDLDDSLPIAPQKQSVWGIDANFEPSEYLGLEGKIAFGSLDRNSFSTLDENESSQSWQLKANSSTDKLEFNANLKFLSKNFYPIGSSLENRARFYYSKNFERENFESQNWSKLGDQKELSFGMRFTPSPPIELDGSIDKKKYNLVDKQIDDRNYDFGFRLKPRNMPNFSGTSQFSRWKNDVYKTHTLWNLSHQFEKLKLDGSLETFKSIDRGFSESENRNQKRILSTVRADLMNVKLAQIYAEYIFEEVSEKPQVDREEQISAFGEWQNFSKANTWKVDFFSQPRKWSNLKANISRRSIGFSDLGRKSKKTQRAEFELRLSPFNRAIDAQIDYRLHQKLTTEKEEIYTNINPHTGKILQPGEGNYLKIDELRYIGDTENGDFIKIVRNIGDKPVSAIDAKFELRFRPRSKNRRNLFRGQIRFDVSEEQENAELREFYLIRNFQNNRTIFGRKNQRYRLEFSPTPKLQLGLNFTKNRHLNRRINERAQFKKTKAIDFRLSANLSEKLSTSIRWKRRKEYERFEEIGLGTVSDLRKTDQDSELNFRYNFTKKISFETIGKQELDSRSELIGDIPLWATMIFSIENRLTYALFGKGRFYLTHRISYGKSSGGVIGGYFSEGISHQIRANANYKIRKFTDLLFRFNYRLSATKFSKATHNLEMEIVAEL